MANIDEMNKNEWSVDVIIPVYQPTEGLFLLLEQLEKQTVHCHQVILINTGKEYFEQLMADLDSNSDSDSQEQQNRRTWFNELLHTGWVKLEHIEKKDFDHGHTRNVACALSNSDFFVMMTDDAIPEDNTLLEKLLAPFADTSVAMTYARQLPASDCHTIERFTRAFNYPVQSQIKASADLRIIGIKAFFASNVCAAYRREIFDSLNGFIDHTIFNEDMIYARGVLDAGYRIAYVAEACVVHSHNYSGSAQLKRNFDLGVSHAMHPEIFADLATESEGIRLVFKTCGHLFHIHKPWLIFKLFWQSGCKYIGYFLGKRYQHLPKGMVRRCSMNREYWDK